MIIQNSKGLFGSKIAIIKNHAEEFFTISTAKESLMDGLSTMIMEGKYPTMRPCVKIIYTKSLKKVDRQGLHDVITETLDNILSEDGKSLYDAIDTIGEEYKKRGIIDELINVAQRDEANPVSNESGFGATSDLINAISTNPVYAIKAHEEELQKYFNISPEEGSEKLIAVYFEYLHLNFNLFDRCAFNALGSERRTQLMKALGRPIAKAAAEKYYEGDYDEITEKILFDDNNSQEEYSQCEELTPPSERMLSEKAMSTILTRRINDILNNGGPLILTRIHVLLGINSMHEHQKESELAELINKSAIELGI